MEMRSTRAGTVLCALLLLAAGAHAQTVTPPEQHFGFNIGDDYRLATYTQLAAYWQKLDRESERVKVEEIGRTAEGRPQLMAIITSPTNHRSLDRYKDIARRLATAEGLTEEQARALAREGKAVVWVDGGLHATEVLGAHQLIETVYRLASRSDAETIRFLDDLVILAVHANPDGMELVSSWYMRHPTPEQRGTGPGIPRLYQKYIGHDNNRDFYLSSQPETTNMNRVMYQEWFPQIVYNHHQSGPAGTVMFAPPFRDPFNYHFDPLVPAQLDLVGAAMHSRFAAEGKPGVTSRQGSSYSTWWNGGLRTTA
jgi:murein tripeptide amidase MpaA